MSIFRLRSTTLRSRAVFDEFGWKQGSEPPSYEIRGEFG
jgi:hypothetical protein